MYIGTVKELFGIIKKTIMSVKKRLWVFFKTMLFWTFALAPLICAVALIPLTEKHVFVSVIIMALVFLEIPWGNAIKDLVDVKK